MAHARISPLRRRLAALRAGRGGRLTSLFALTQLAGAAMIDAGRGSIINVASLAAERSVDRTRWRPAKAGVVALTRSLAAGWGQHGIRVSAIGPASFPTHQSGFLSDPEQVAWIQSHTALGRAPRLGEPDGTIVFPASDASSYITGHTCSSTADGPSIEMARPDTAAPCLPLPHQHAGLVSEID